MINKDECRKIGYVLKTHGVNGELVLAFEIEEFNNILEKGQLFIEIDGYLVPFFIESFRIKNINTVIVKFFDTDSIDSAKQFLELSVLANTNETKPNKPKEFSQYIGFILIDSYSKNKGEIIDFIDYSGNKNFIIKKDKQEFIIPASKDFIDSIDKGNKIIIMNLPEGLFDLN